MRPIEKLISKFRIDTNPDRDRQILGQLLRAQENSKHQTIALNRDIRKISTRSKIAATLAAAAAVIVVLAVSRLTVSDKGGLPRPGGPEMAAVSKTPAELLSAFSLNMAFRDGGIEAVTEQFQQAREKVKRGQTKRLTIDQLICELEECEKI